MSTSMVRLRDETRQLLQEMAAEDRLSMQEVAARAVEVYRRQRMLEQINSDFAALRENAEAWEAYRAELSDWERALPDGIE